MNLRYAAADCDHRARQFVTENLRRRDEAVMNLLDVRAADAARGHAEEHFSLANFWNRHGLDDHSSFAAIHPRAHLAGFARRVVRFEVFDRVAHSSASELSSAASGPRLRLESFVFSRDERDVPIQKSRERFSGRFGCSVPGAPGSEPILDCAQLRQSRAAGSLALRR